MNILILGMPNVGKTSLFNIITNQDSNIIHKTVGTTRTGMLHHLLKIITSISTLQV